MRRLPKNIILIDQHNIAKIGTKITAALKSTFQVHHLLLRDNVVTPLQAKKAFSLDPKETLIIFIEPGNLAYRPKVPFDRYLFPQICGVPRPRNIPFGILWCGSVYRIDNYAKLMGLPPKHIKHLYNRRSYINKQTSLRMCATECLVNIDAGSQYIGQPYGNYNTKIPYKNFSKHKIIHIPTAPASTNEYKGTHRIRKAFNQLENIMETEIIPYGTSHDEIINKLRSATMFCLTMTDWDSGTGYSGIEALSEGCLVFSRKPKGVSTPIIHVENPEQLIKKVKYFASQYNKYHKGRETQFIYGKKKFSNEGFVQRIKNVIGKWSA